MAAMLKILIQIFREEERGGESRANIYHIYPLIYQIIMLDNKEIITINDRKIIFIISSLNIAHQNQWYNIVLERFYQLLSHLAVSLTRAYGLNLC